jgi:hypothetical protein
MPSKVSEGASLRTGYRGNLAMPVCEWVPSMAFIPVCFHLPSGTRPLSLKAEEMFMLAVTRGIMKRNKQKRNANSRKSKCFIVIVTCFWSKAGTVNPIFEYWLSNPWYRSESDSLVKLLQCSTAATSHIYINLLLCRYLVYRFELVFPSFETWLRMDYKGIGLHQIVLFVCWNSLQVESSHRFSKLALA